MPVYSSFVDDVLRHIGAALYILVLVTVFVAFVYQLVMYVKDRRKEKEDEIRSLSD